MPPTRWCAQKLFHFTIFLNFRFELIQLQIRFKSHSTYPIIVPGGGWNAIYGEIEVHPPWPGSQKCLTGQDNREAENMWFLDWRGSWEVVQQKKTKVNTYGYYFYGWTIYNYWIISRYIDIDKFFARICNINRAAVARSVDIVNSSKIFSM